MNKLLTASLPALALLALGGCTASRSVTTTEDDGVYYSSKDRTTAVAQRAPLSQPSPTVANADAGEATNPDYQGNSNTQRRATNAPEYYDDNYASSSYGDSRFRQPYAGPTVGLAYYSPPVVFAPAISYGWGGGAYGYSPYGSVFCDPLYSPYYASPFFSPYAYASPFGGYGYGGSYFGMSFGHGWSYYGGHGYGRPYYGGYGYEPFYSQGYYGGGGYYNGGGGYYNGGGGYYNGGGGHHNGGGYYGGRQPVRAYGNNPTASNPVLVGPRRGRGGDVLAGRGNMQAPSGTTPALPNSGGRRNMTGGTTTPSGVVASGATAPANAPAVITNNGRRRTDSNTAYPAPNSPTPISGYDQRPEGGRLGQTGAGRSDNPTPTNDPNRGRGRNQNDGNTATGTVSGYGTDRGGDESQPQVDVQPMPQIGGRQPRRGRVFENAPATGQGQVVDTDTHEQPAPQPQRTYEQPAPQPQRTYEQPQRTYEQPRRAERPQRTYEQPTQSQSERTYERPSYSPPSNSQSSSDGGGNGGGGGGGGGGGRRGGRQ